MFDDRKVLHEITLPPETKTFGDQFVFVKLRDDTFGWRPALLIAWHRTPHGWACTVKTPRYRAVGGWITRSATYAYSPAYIQKLTADDLNPAGRRPREPDVPKR